MNGFDDPKLAELFKKRTSTGITASLSSHHSHVGAVVGGVVGGVAGLAIVGGVLWWLTRQRRKTAQDNTHRQPGPVDELDGHPAVGELDESTGVYEKPVEERALDWSQVRMRGIAFQEGSREP